MKFTVRDWIDSQDFAPGSEPSENTVRRWCEKGEIQAEKIGGRWYIIDGEAANDEEVQQLVDMVING